MSVHTYLCTVSRPVDIRYLSIVSSVRDRSLYVFKVYPDLWFRVAFPPTSRFTHPSLMLGSGVPGHPAAIPHPAIVPSSGKQELQPYDRSL